MRFDLSDWLLAVSPVDVEGICFSKETVLTPPPASVLTIDPFMSVPFFDCFVTFFCADGFFGFVMFLIL